VSVIRSTIGPTGPGVKAVAGRVVVGPVGRVGSPLGLQPRHPGRELEQQRAELPFRQPEQQQPEQPQQQPWPASREYGPRSVAGRPRTPGAYAGCPGIHPAPAVSFVHGPRAACVGRLPGKEEGAPGFVATPLGGEHPGASGSMGRGASVSDGRARILDHPPGAGRASPGPGLARLTQRDPSLGLRGETDNRS
jgi:hypothetical protein